MNERVIRLDNARKEESGAPCLIPQTSPTYVCKGMFTQEMNAIIVDSRATTNRRGKLFFWMVTVLNVVLEIKLFAPETNFFER